MDGQVIEPKLTFAGHLQELRRRLTWPALILLVGSSVAYLFHNRLISFLKAPLHQTLYYNSPAGGFNFIMKICFITGLTLAIPVLIYNLISFIEPAVDKKITRRLITMVTLLSLTLGLAGAAFAYYGALPMSLHFFGNINISGVNPLISANDYLNFALTCILTFIILFQLPLLVLFINHIKPFPPGKLLKYEKYVIVGSLAIALVLPFSYDPLTQFLIAVPIIVLYNLSIMLVYVANHGRWGKKSTATVVKQALPPAPAPTTFSEPILEQPVQPRPGRRPVFDVAPQALGAGNFLDLRAKKTI
jgi:sec-independent protein translocase protein TatC